MGKIRCANSECKNMVDVLHMDDDGYCDDCHNKILDGLRIEESEETKFLSEESLDIMCKFPIKIRSSRPSIDWRRKPYR